ncbi:hypothetical protein CYMTET_34185, partial [Cymbomonas tetramitiformis]
VEAPDYGEAGGSTTSALSASKPVGIMKHMNAQRAPSGNVTFAPVAALNSAQDEGQSLAKSPTISIPSTMLTSSPSAPPRVSTRFKQNRHQSGTLLQTSPSTKPPVSPTAMSLGSPTGPPKQLVPSITSRPPHSSSSPPSPSPSHVPQLLSPANANRLPSTEAPTRSTSARSRLTSSPSHSALLVESSVISDILPHGRLHAPDLRAERSFPPPGSGRTDIADLALAVEQAFASPSGKRSPARPSSGPPMPATQRPHPRSESVPPDLLQLATRASTAAPGNPGEGLAKLGEFLEPHPCHITPCHVTSPPPLKDEMSYLSDTSGHGASSSVHQDPLWSILSSIEARHANQQERPGSPLGLPAKLMLRKPQLLAAATSLPVRPTALSRALGLQGTCSSSRSPPPCLRLRLGHGVRGARYATGCAHTQCPVVYDVRGAVRSRIAFCASRHSLAVY